MERFLSPEGKGLRSWPVTAASACLDEVKLHTPTNQFSIHLLHEDPHPRNGAVILGPDPPAGVAGGGGQNPAAGALSNADQLDLVPLLRELLDEVCLVGEDLAAVPPI